MPFRRSAAAALVVLAFVSGCKDVTQESSPGEIVVAAFNSPVWPASTCGGNPLDLRCNPAIPTPNDLALQAEPTLPAVAPLAAQKALLKAFIAAGGFPSDQAVGLSIPIKRVVFDAANNVYVLSTPPTVNQATVTTAGAAANVVVMKIDGKDESGAPSADPVRIAVELDAANCTTGQIAVQKAASPLTGSRAWAPGRYAFAMRGGASGVKTATGAPIGPDQVITLVAPNLDLTNPQNQPPGGLSPALAAQADAVRKALWNPVDWNNAGGFWTANAAGAFGAFPAISSVIPVGDVAVIGTFEVAPAAPVAPIDAVSGIAPLPLDLLRTANAGTTIAFNSAFGPAAAGLTTLDGFSTTGTIFAPVSVPIDAATVNGGTVQLYKISGSGAPRALRELKLLLGTGGNPLTAEYVAQPDPLNVASGINVAPGLNCQKAGGCSLAVAVQPGVGAPVGPPVNATFYLPPLEEATDYAVVITTAVKDIFGRPLQQSTIAKMLVGPGFDPLATSSVNGTSYVTGVSNEQATALQKMRQQLAPIVAALPHGATDVALAWTFRTQSIASTSVQLSVAPYGSEQAATHALFVPVAASTTAPAGGPYPNVAQFYTVTFPSIDATDKTTGALNPNQGAWGQALLQAIVAVPSAANPNLPSCPPPAAALKCAPLVVFGHGLGGKKEDMLAVADSLAARGFVAAAIDFPQHGGRSWCFANAQCDNGGSAGTCTPFAGGLGQGDVVGGVPTAPGTCTVGVPITSGAGSISGQTFISANFFRTRDAFRQNLIDQAALVLALARPPLSQYPFQPASTDPFTAAIEAAGLFVNPGAVYWEGISLGGIAGTNVLATNPRFSTGVTSVAGGTLVDVFTHAPAFQSRVNALFTGLLKAQLDAIAPNTPFTPALVDGTNASFNAGVAAQYLKTVVLAKWILDPSDPLNFAAHLISSPLPNLLANPNGSVPQAAKNVLGQVAINDQVIPNLYNRELFKLGGVNVVEYTSLTYTAAQMHGILGFDPTVQSDAAHYLFDLTTPPAPPTQVTIP